MNTEPSLKEVEVSFVLPCLNESATLEHCIVQAHSTINTMEISGEIIVADNGSVDDSRQIALQLGARVIEVAERGYGAALIQGCRAAAGKFIVMADADASYDLLESIPMVRLLNQGADLVVGTRLKGRILSGAMPWMNQYIGNPFLTTVLNLLFQSGLSDTHCGLRAFTRQAYELMELRTPGMEFASEMIVKASMLRMKLQEVPITYHPDGRNRAPHLHPWRDGWRHLLLLLRYNPTRSFIIPGLLLFMLGLVANTIMGVLTSASIIHLGALSINRYWMIPTSLVALLGQQIALMGLTIQRVSTHQKCFPPPNWFLSFSRKITRDTSLWIGGGLIIFGLVIELPVLIEQVKLAFNPFQEFQKSIYGLMWIFLGLGFLINRRILGLITSKTNPFQNAEVNSNLEDRSSFAYKNSVKKVLSNE